MQNHQCPTCGRETIPDAACPECNHAATNGADGKKTWIKPPPPPEAANWVIEPVPPGIIEEFDRTFNEEEFWAEARELERTGGVQIDDLIAELERRVNGST